MLVNFFIFVIIDDFGVGKNKVFIMGFPGVGMAGAIAAEYIVNFLKLPLKAQIISSKLPAVALVRKSRPQAPIRIYEGPNVAILVSDIMIPDDFAYEFAEELTDWLKEKEPSEVVVLGGMPRDPKSVARRVYVISWKTRYLDEITADHMKLGFLMGVFGPLMLSLARKEFSGFGLFIEADPEPDPKSASILIKMVSERYNLDVSTEKLEKIKQEKVGAKTWDPYPSIYA